MTPRLLATIRTGSYWTRLAPSQIGQSVPTATIRTDAEMLESLDRAQDVPKSRAAHGIIVDRPARSEWEFRPAAE